MTDRNKIEVFGEEFLVPLHDVECARAVKKQVFDVNKAMAYCKNMTVCVQAGGNMGIWPNYLSGYFSYVYTFEPHPENFFCLARNCPQENIIKIQAGLSDEGDCFSIDGDPKNAGAYQMAGRGWFPTLALDSFMLQALDLLTLDIEGMEMKALKGAEGHIEKFEPVIMLEDKGLSDRYGTKKGDITAWLENKGYKMIEAIHRDLIFVKE